MHRLVALSALALAALLATRARADIPPSPDSPNAHCTRDQQCPNGETCPYAWNPGDRSGEAERVGADCRVSVQARGLERRCRNGGNYSGDELFCPPGETGSWSPPGSKPGPSADAKVPAKTEPAEPTKPEPAQPEPAKSEPAKSEPPTSRAGMCSVAPHPAPAVLLLALGLGRRRRLTRPRPCAAPPARPAPPHH